MVQAKFVLKQIYIISLVNLGKCSIDGISYMDPSPKRSLSNLYPHGEDPCNPLYWYPRNIPEYCYYRNFPFPKNPVPPQLTVPIPVPKPIPMPMAVPMPVPMPQPNIIMPIPTLPGLAPLPYGAPMPPFASSNPMLPVPSVPVYPPVSYPYESYPQQTGMVPGLPGLVTKDGGINILPFSDVYSDILENHKNRMIRRRLKKLIQDYEDYPNGRNYDRLRKYARNDM